MAIFCSVKSIEENYLKIRTSLEPFNAELVAVSKLQSIESIEALYNLGHRDFGENYVQECCEKSEKLSEDIRWHFIGHLQTNKAKYISPFIHLIHGVDSLKLLKEINKQAVKLNRKQTVLIQIHIASEETKFGFSFEEAEAMFQSQDLMNLNNVQIQGFMGMASFSEDITLVRNEFRSLKSFYDKTIKSYPAYTNYFKYLSMGMTSDYKIALDEGSNLVRIGSAIFGERKKAST